MIGLEELTKIAQSYEAPENLPVQFNPDHYFRQVIKRLDDLEVALVCFGSGQTSTVHDHQGSNCVVRMIRGKAAEILFEEKDGQLNIIKFHYIKPGEVSGLDGVQIHQIVNCDQEGSVFVNFYSPPFQV